MKYYSEEIVRKIYENALIVGINDAISKAKSIELPDKYGRLIDADAFFEADKEEQYVLEYAESVIVSKKIYYRLQNAPTILEASTEGEVNK